MAEYSQHGISVVAQPQTEYGYRNGQLLVTAQPWINLALNKPATQIDNHAPTTTASKAVDGNADSALWDGTTSATNYHQNSWWQVDLQSVQTISSITVWDRTDCCPEMTSNFYVFVSNAPFTSYDLNTTLSQSGVSSYYYANWSAASSVPVNRTGRYVRVQLAGTQYLVLGEVQVWGGVAQVSWQVADQLGTPRIVADRTGSASGISRHDYLPFGEALPDTFRNGAAGYPASDTMRQKFTAKERDGETGLDYFNARYYGSPQGRFTSTDPVTMTVGRLSDPQQINLYAYCRNNPLVTLDPTGEKIEYKNKESEEEYKEYVAYLENCGKKCEKELATVVQLKDSDVTYVINVAEKAGAGEGELSTDGNKIFININNVGGAFGENFSRRSRFAHELEHGRQFDSGELSFIKNKHGNWVPNPGTYDIGDEVKAFQAMQHVAEDSDYSMREPGTNTRKPSLLREFANAKTDQERADVLSQSAYPRRNQRRDSDVAFSSDSGYKPGQLVQTGDYFARVKRVFDRPK